MLVAVSVRFIDALTLFKLLVKGCVLLDILGLWLPATTKYTSCGGRGSVLEA